MINSKSFWIAGKHSVISVLHNENRHVEEVVFSNFEKNYISQDLINKNKKTKFKQVEKVFFKKIFKDNDLVHQNIAARIQRIEKEDIKKNLLNINKIIILDNITDPRNIGSIIRSSVAFDIEAMVIKDRNFPYKSPLMYKASSGAIEKIKIFEVINLSSTIEFLKQKNFWIYAFDGNSKKTMNKEILNNKKKAFIFGSEQDGISKNVKNKSDFILKIQINEKKIESLNVSNAVSASLAIDKFLDS